MEINETVIARWCRQLSTYNIGLLLGERSGVIALDYDYGEEIHEHIKKLLPPSPFRKKGKKGETLFYRFNGEVSKKWSRQGETVVELLSTGLAYLS